MMRRSTLSLLAFAAAPILVQAQSPTAPNSNPPVVNFDKSKDLFIAQFDSKPDPDDIHAIAAIGSMLAHPDLHGVDFYGVQGTVGMQGYNNPNMEFIPAPGLMTLAFGAQNVRWTQAGKGKGNTFPNNANFPAGSSFPNNMYGQNDNWVPSVNRVRDKAKTALDRGGKVYVMEAGNSDFTHDWVQSLINTTAYTVNDTKTRIVVVQHSNWNENNTTTTPKRGISGGANDTVPAGQATILEWVRNNTDYRRIEDGNWANSTPDYTDNNTTWQTQAEASTNPNVHARNLWREADSVLAAHGHFPSYSQISTGGVDYSDAAEAWYIFNIGNKVSNNVNTTPEFWARYVTNTDSASGPVPGPSGGSGSNGTPYGGSARAVPGAIEAEDYNVGGQGVAYSDATTGNTGSSNYRSDGVDLWDGNAQDPARLVGAIANGEYLNYDVNVTPGTFDIVARVAIPDNSTTRRIDVTIDGISLGSFNLSSTGGWRNFQDFTIPGVTLGVGGLRDLRLTMVGGNFNLDKVTFVSTGGGTPGSGPFKFDFGTASSPLESGYTRITPSTTTGSARWTSTTGLQDRDRNSSTSLNRDMNLSQSACTFSVDLANGTYDVKVRMGDIYAHAGMAISAEGVSQASNISNGANQWIDETFTVSVSDGTLDLQFSAPSGPWWVVNAVEITASSGASVSLSYDLGTSNSPLQSGYTRITESTSTGTARWLNTSGLASRDRSTVSDSQNRDLVFDNLPAVFAINVPNGTYTVSVTIGDVYAVDDIVVKAEGTTVASNIDRAVNQWLPVNFTATVSDGTLNLEFSDGGGTNPNWIVNSITVNSQ
ncbi:carbohydrate-binding domain-containing protein [Coraliomargarita akajimensis]|uniref:Carbohydrate binding family 6 n=1 Tax=Coraliomargarita akajimensis (strain DSM 45221 / IAM 15411 / JCM 23193 / KCTC 12865 / 04OKA010-24) TaxID=583355 RepID=D5EL47_CORAD|nr:carbohydrate-binding domain-containing protein [Coraliomargarita akajimensis]ADE53149.1 Carbohydrate binding family 6 [Coraliomargarita akajimensis DSM 45221]